VPGTSRLSSFFFSLSLSLTVSFAICRSLIALSSPTARSYSFRPPLSFPLSLSLSRSLSLSLSLALSSSSLSSFFSFSSLYVFPSRASASWHTTRTISLSGFQTCVLPAAAHAPTRRPPIPFHKVLPLPRVWVLPRMKDVRSRTVSCRWLQVR